MSVNSAALGFSALVSVSAGLLFGLVTAWHTVGREATGDVRATLKQSERASVSLRARSFLGSTLVSLQVGLALVLLLGAGLLARTLLALVRVDPGFRAANVLRTQIVLAPEHYSPERQVSFFSELLERTREDKNAPAVAIISRSLAEHYFGDQNPIGKRVRDSSSESDTTWLTVVGVVGDVRRYSVDTPGIAEVYRPLTQNPINFMTLVVHTAGDPLRLSSAVRASIKDLDPELPLQAIGTMEQLAAQGVAATRRLPALLLALFAGFALLLAAVGIHGVVAYSVSRRTAEIGIRMALGARRTDVWALVVRQGMRPVWLGAAVGTTLSGALVPTISALLYGIEPSDALTWTAALGTVLGVALLACAVPAWRATAIEPVSAIRRE